MQQFLKVFVFLFFVSFVVQGQNMPAPKPKKTRILFLLDGSGSMNAKWENSVRMTVAKELLSKMVDSLKTHKNLEMALRVYGHQFPNKENNCTDSKLEVGFAPGNSDQIKKRIKAISAKGNTPITYSLEQSAKDFPADPNSRNVIIIITDGLESCKGDPCKASLALQKRRIFLRPFVIGIGATEEFQKQFECVGQYYNAADIKTFSNVLDDVVTTALSTTTVSVELKDEQGKPVETNVNMTFINTVTGEPEYNYVHYLDANGKTDILDIDALLNYDLVINTIPAIVEKNLKIKAGKHNVFSVTAPQGYLNFRQEAPTAYGTVTAIIRKNGSPNTLAWVPYGSTQKLLAGKYDIELLTLPRFYLNDVQVKQGETKIVTYPMPGLLNVTSDLQGYGSIYSIDKEGSQHWIYNIAENSSKINLPLLPGKYRLVFRAKSARASKFTESKDFTITSGKTTTMKLFGQ